MNKYLTFSVLLTAASLCMNQGNPFEKADSFYLNAQYNEARQEYEKLLKEVENSSEEEIEKAKRNLGICQYACAVDCDSNNEMNQLWIKGWQNLQYRLKKEERDTWDGNPCPVVLIKAHDGIGDNACFARFCKKLRQLGVKVIFKPQRGFLKHFYTLFDGCFDEVLDPKDPDPKNIPTVDIISLVSHVSDLGFGSSTPGTVPQMDNYIVPEKGVIEKLQEQMNPDKVHITVWNTGAGATPVFGRVLNRNIPLKVFTEAARGLPIQLWHAQIEGPITQSEFDKLSEEQKSKINRLNIIHDEDKEHIRHISDEKGKAFGVTVAILALTHNIGCDTSIANIAANTKGEMDGRKVIMCLPSNKNSAARWGTKRNDTPLNPGLEIIRQKKDGDWSDVKQQLRARMEKLVEQKKAKDNPGLFTTLLNKLKD